MTMAEAAFLTGSQPFAGWDERTTATNSASGIKDRLVRSRATTHAFVGQRPNVVEIDIPGDYPKWLPGALGRLVSLLQLPPGWDTYGSLPISPTALVSILSALAYALPPDVPEPSIVPTSDGGIQVEWHVAGIDIESQTLDGTALQTWVRDMNDDFCSEVEEDATRPSLLMEGLNRLARSHIA